MENPEKFARTLDFDWVLDVRSQCIETDIPFCFHQTGSYLLKNERTYSIPRSYQHSQARKAGLNTNADYEKSLREADENG